MPKKGGGRNRRKVRLVFLPVQTTLALSTLGDNTVLKGSLLTLNEDFFFLGAKLLWTKRDGTTGQGPIKVGLANDDLSVGEIAEAISASPTSPDDIIAIERSRRPVRTVGAFPQIATDEVLNNGVEVKTTLRITIGDTVGLALWAMNRSGAPLATGTVIGIEGIVYGKWMR